MSWMRTRNAPNSHPLRAYWYGSLCVHLPALPAQPRSVKRTVAVVLAVCVVGAVVAFASGASAATLRGVMNSGMDCETVCEPGFYFTPEGDADKCNEGILGGHCAPCPPGTFIAEGGVKESCDVCPAGTYTGLTAGVKDEAQAACLGACPEGKTNCAPGSDGCNRHAHYMNILPDGVTEEVPCS